MMTVDTLPITGLPGSGLPAAVLVCGDPQRAGKIADYFDGARLLSERREYHAYTGHYSGVPVAVCSHGVGASGAAVAFEELVAAGTRYLIRVGTCGGLQPDVQDGGLVLATAAVDATGYGRLTVPPGYPAAAGLRLSHLLLHVAREGNQALHSGLVLTSDNFYRGVQTPYTPDYQTLSKAHVLAVEMECAALFHIGNLRQVETAAILAVDGNVLEQGETMDSYNPQRDVVGAAVEAAIELALEAVTRAARGE